MKLWGGRFEKKTDGLVDDFHSSITFDKRLYHQDIAGSIAHATMLGEQGIIPQADADAIVEGLKGIEADIAAGKVQFELDAEDIHMNVEKLLIERIGDAGKRLHTGRSRNDQVALDVRMYVKRTPRRKPRRSSANSAKPCLTIAEEEHAILSCPAIRTCSAPSPITLGHHMMAYV